MKHLARPKHGMLPVVSQWRDRVISRKTIHLRTFMRAWVGKVRGCWLGLAPILVSEIRADVDYLTRAWIALYKFQLPPG